jgi:hypothetical protein
MEKFKALRKRNDCFNHELLSGEFEDAAPRAAAIERIDEEFSLLQVALNKRARAQLKKATQTSRHDRVSKRPSIKDFFTIDPQASAASSSDDGLRHAPSSSPDLATVSTVQGFHTILLTSVQLLSAAGSASTPLQVARPGDENEEDEDEMLFDLESYEHEVDEAPPSASETVPDGLDNTVEQVEAEFDFSPFMRDESEVEVPSYGDISSGDEFEEAGPRLQVTSREGSREADDVQVASQSEEPVVSAASSIRPPIASESRVQDAPSNRGKKNRKVIDSMPMRVWVPSADSRGAWRPMEELSGSVRTKLIAAFNKVIRNPVRHRNLWARWQDPINRSSHYDQCIGHGIVAKAGATFASNHEACSYCVKRGFVCALIHKVKVDSDFVGILPLSAELRQGHWVDDMEFWLSK